VLVSQGVIACNWVGCIRCSWVVQLVRKDGVAKGCRRSCALVPNGLFTWLPTEIEEREKKLATERAVKRREKKAKWKAEVRKRNAHKREVLVRKEERERRMGNGTAGRFILSHYLGR
jgi:hypothetical protein